MDVDTSSFTVKGKPYPIVKTYDLGTRHLPHSHYLTVNALLSDVPSFTFPSLRYRSSIDTHPVLPTTAYRNEVVRSYKDVQLYRPKVKQYLTSSYSSWYNVPFSPKTTISRSRWSRQTTKF